MTIPSLEAPAFYFTKAFSHRQKVMRLYKRAIRETQSWHAQDLLECRFRMCLMRARFDANRDVNDMRLAQYLLADGCRQLWMYRNVSQTMRYPEDPGAPAYDRDMESSDVVCDDPNHYTWAEREQFPYYFNRREQRKKELMAHWHKIEKAWDEELDAIQRELPKEEKAKTIEQGNQNAIPFNVLPQ
ncbi:hypothetical protein niasHS_010193 [Heterodera schachtii]|uniref:NADH dehydrogenase [ubiquinone] 1 beta subcomplex subunit 9 n=1 Tax=Heterodera schachtii TaxID=97005 RepID=A0ABD2IZ12_HETSC